MADVLETAREAAGRHDWAEARAAFHTAGQSVPLEPDDLVRLGDASWWSGDPDDAVDAYERAYTGYVTAGAKGRAAYVATQLAYLAFRRAAFSVGSGWMTKAEQVLADDPGAREQAWVKLLYAAGAAMAERDAEKFYALVDEAIALGRERQVPEVHAMGTSLKGYTMIGAGDWRRGLSFIDEAATEAVSGQLDLRTACDVYCNTIAACRNMADYGRAGEWVEEADRWMERNSLGGYPGICKVHRAELNKLHGDYAEAERQARVACEELERYRLLDAVASAHKEMGEVRLRRGDLDTAEESLAKAYEYGSDAQPARAQLLLARGDPEGAARSIASALGDRAGEGDDRPAIRLSRSRLLPTQVTIALANGDLSAALAATEELEQIAAEFERPAFEAAALLARGAVELAQERPDVAVGALDQSWRRWRDIDFPYESAQARVLLGRAHLAAGDAATAKLEFEAARSGFDRLGAGLDAQRVDELLGDDARVGGDGRRVTKTFMFTDIVTSTDLVSLLGDEAWDDLIRWHDRAVRSEFAKHHGHEVRHTGDGFFVTFDRAADGVEAAVAIQRRLAKHRAEHGFAPWVRIGLHTAEATPQGGDYAGQGVHVAARVGDVGEREEIVVSADGLEAAGAVRFPVSEAQAVSLKGVKDDVMVHTVEWR